MFRVVGFLIGLLTCGTAAVADMVQIQPLKDNTLIQRTDPLSQLSNGQGDISVGRTNQDGQGPATNSIRRGLIAFDIAGSLPNDAVITGVSLVMRDLMGLNGDPSVKLHRVLQDWGEGSSFQNGGMGAPAADGDATWLFTSFDASDPTASPAWTMPGGDFDSTPSGSAIVSDDLGGGQFFTWSSEENPAMLSDVQSWVENPELNFGWIIIGDETRGQSAKRFNSGESASAPILTIEYTAVPEASSLVLAAASLLAVCAVHRIRRS